MRHISICRILCLMSSLRALPHMTAVFPTEPRRRPVRPQTSSSRHAGRRRGRYGPRRVEPGAGTRPRRPRKFCTRRGQRPRGPPAQPAAVCRATPPEQEFERPEEGPRGGRPQPQRFGCRARPGRHSGEERHQHGRRTSRAVAGDSLRWGRCRRLAVRHGGVGAERR